MASSRFCRRRLDHVVEVPFVERLSSVHPEQRDGVHDGSRRSLSLLGLLPRTGKRSRNRSGRSGVPAEIATSNSTSTSTAPGCERDAVLSILSTICRADADHLHANGGARLRAVQPRPPPGAFHLYPERDHIDAILENAASSQVEVIVARRRRSSAWDQGTGGMGSRSASFRLHGMRRDSSGHDTADLTATLARTARSAGRPVLRGWRHERISGVV